MQTTKRTQSSQTSRLHRIARVFTGLTATAAALAMTGCTTGFGGGGSVATGPALQGQVIGGQQPVSGSTIQLRAASQIGYGAASTSLIAAAVTTDANGNFSITGDYTCPYPTAQVYLTATGGNSGAGANANLVLMAPLGACSTLNSGTRITMNELTTIAGAYALAPFMSSPTQLSVSPTNVTGLSNAFATVNKLVNVSIGQTPGATLPAGATEPTALLNTLADIIASCVNTDGVGGSSTNCATLFSNATPPGGTAPTDTLTAALNIAKYPADNTSALFDLAVADSPFLPKLMSPAPTAYTVSIRYAPSATFSAPSAAAVDSSGNLWVTNSGNNSITVLAATTGAPTINTGGSLNAPSAIAFDASGNAWVPNKGNSTLSAFSPADAGSVVLTTNLSAPTGVAIDAQGLIWVTNSGSNNVTSVTPSGLSVTSSTTYPAGGGGAAVAINPH